MPDRPLRITRDAIELGTLPEAEARELLQLGLLFGAAYDCLPPVCRFVAEERFIANRMQHRSRLLDLPETGKEGDRQ